MTELFKRKDESVIIFCRSKIDSFKKGVGKLSGVEIESKNHLTKPFQDRKYSVIFCII